MIELPAVSGFGQFRAAMALYSDGSFLSPMSKKCEDYVLSAVFRLFVWFVVFFSVCLSVISHAHLGIVKV